MSKQLVLPCEVGEVSDGFHTFNELYEHRVELFIALCRQLCYNYAAPDVWRSVKHSDGTSYDGWFIMGIRKDKGLQMSYHLPINKWGITHFAETLEVAPEWDGHTPEDTLTRIRTLLK